MELHVICNTHRGCMLNPAVSMWCKNKTYTSNKPTIFHDIHRSSNNIRPVTINILVRCLFSILGLSSYNTWHIYFSWTRFCSINVKYEHVLHKILMCEGKFLNHRMRIFRAVWTGNVTTGGNKRRRRGLLTCRHSTGGKWRPQGDRMPEKLWWLDL